MKTIEDYLEIERHPEFRSEYIDGDGDEDTLTDATLIVEVLSRSTRYFRSGRKIPL